MIITTTLLLRRFLIYLPCTVVNVTSGRCFFIKDVNLGMKEGFFKDKADGSNNPVLLPWRTKSPRVWVLHRITESVLDSLPVGLPLPLSRLWIWAERICPSGDKFCPLSPILPPCLIFYISTNDNKPVTIKRMYDKKDDDYILINDNEKMTINRWRKTLIINRKKRM